MIIKSKTAFRLYSQLIPKGKFYLAHQNPKI